MLKMNIRQLLGVVAFLTFFSGGAMTQNLSVSYKNKPLEEVLADLKQKTNYNFVYQKQILAGTRSVTANFNDMPLTYILDRVLYNNGLDYEIVKENVIIRPADKENFKKVVSGRVVPEYTYAGRKCTGEGYRNGSGNGHQRRIFHSGGG